MFFAPGLWVGEVMKLRKPDNHPPHLYEMAKGLSLERRLHPRVKIPVQNWKDFTGPRVIIEGQVFSMNDISEGGLCLLDPSESLEFKIGQQINLLIECGERFQVPSRLVAMNLTRRHIQFLEPSLLLRQSLREWIQSGLRGQWLKTVSASSVAQDHPILWSSIYDDNLTRSEDPRWQFNFYLDSEVYHLSSELWPVDGDELKPISVEKFDRLLMCFENLTFTDEVSVFLKQMLFRVRRRSFE